MVHNELVTTVYFIRYHIGRPPKDSRTTSTITKTIDDLMRQEQWVVRSNEWWSVIMKLKIA